MRVVLGVSGGIAAYKAAQIVREFVKRGDEVRVVMTQGASAFIAPLTLQVLSGHSVGQEVFDARYESEIGHIDLARWADVVLLAPATAHLIAKIAHGMADDLLTTIVLATDAPVIVAPAMNTVMLDNRRVQRNIGMLRAEPDVHIIEPDAGELACKEVGKGRLPDPDVLLEAVDRVVHPARPLSGLRVLVTAGPTREHLDPARFISNPSSGKMGYALARVAWSRGAQVTLVSGPVALAAPAIGVELVDVVSAQQMHEAVMARAGEVDVVIKAAAVADWRPATASERKRSKGEMDARLELVRNPDILAELGARFGDQAGGPLLVGFAAESHDIVERARAKRARKGAHMIVANRIGGEDSSFEAASSSIVVLDPDGAATPYGPALKDELAGYILDHVAAAVAGRPKD